VTEKTLGIINIGPCLTIGNAWFDCMRQIFTRGHKYLIDRGSFQGQHRLECDFIVIQITKPWIKPLVPDVPQGVPPPMDSNYIGDYLSYLMTSSVQPNEQYTYGYYLEPQIPKVIDMYKKAGYGTNQAFMAVGDQNSIDLEDPPCLRGIDTRVRYGKLHFMVYFRSWDLWGGFPVNLAGIQELKEYMAKEIGVEDGEIIATSKGLHLYEHHWDLAKIVLGEK